MPWACMRVWGYGCSSKEPRGEELGKEKHAAEVVDRGVEDPFPLGVTGQEMEGSFVLDQAPMAVVRSSRPWAFSLGGGPSWSSVTAGAEIAVAETSIPSFQSRRRREELL